MRLRDWTLRARALFAPRRVERELDDELSFHVERETQKLLDQGLSPSDARARALARFGPQPLAADECRDARGTAFVDNSVRDILYALRTFQRAPLVAFTIVSTVALGLSLVAVAFTMLNAMLFRTDAVPNVHEMFGVTRSPTGGERQPFTRAQFDALRRETGVFTDAYAEVSQIPSYVDGRLVFGTFVSGNCFQVLGVGAAMGRTLTPGDDQPFAEQPVMVLSHRGWDRLFARDPAIVGRRMLLNGATFEIVGVMPEQFRGLVLEPDDYWAPISALRHARPIPPGREATVNVAIVGRLKPGLTPQSARAGLEIWDSGRSNHTPAAPSALRESQGRPEPERRPINLVRRRGTIEPTATTTLAVFAPLFFAFGLVLLIGCANVANLLLARGVARQREIGIRLSLGATRRRIVRQLLTESLILALLAAVAGFAISRVLLAAIINAVMSSMPPDIGDIRLMVPDADWRVALFLIAGAAMSTMFFGLAPALQATRIEPIRTIRGEVVPLSNDARPGRARNLLIGVQVGASALLLISAAVFLRSAFAAASFDTGVRTADTIVVQIANERTRTTLVNAVTAEPTVAAVAASWPDAPRAAFAETGGTRTAIAYKLVSPEYFGVLNIAVTRGRAFTPAERTSTLAVAVVSETAARTLWPNADAIGQVVRLDPDPAAQPRDANDRSAAPSGAQEEPALESRTCAVVGVVRDVAGLRIAPFKKAVVYLPTSAETPRTSLVARVHGDPERARQALLTRLTTIDSTMAREVVTMRTLARIDTYFLQIAFWLTVAVGGLALALTLSGLFSVLSYLVEQRTREIGVRLALGATTRDVTRLVLSQSIRPVAVGLAIGTGAAAGLAALLLATPAAAAIGAIVHVLDPLAYAVSVLIIVSACLVAASIPATRAAHLDPNRALRQE